MQTVLSDKYHIATELITDYGVTETVELWSVHTLSKKQNSYSVDCCCAGI